MARYIEETEIYKLVEPHGTAKVHCSQIDELPRADVVPKSEVEQMVQGCTRLVQENETLKDNNEHLAVILEETKAEVEKLQNELVIWKQNRFNIFQRLECYETARQKVASEIFAEIERLMLDGAIGGKYPAKIINPDKYAELKKKYRGASNEHSKRDF